MNTIEKLALAAFVPLFTVWLTDRPVTSFPVVVSVSVSVVPVLVSVVPVLVSVVVSVVGPVVVVGSVVVGGGSVVDVSVVGGFVVVGGGSSVVPDDDEPVVSVSVSVAPMTSSPHPSTSTPDTSITTGPHLGGVRRIHPPFLKQLPGVREPAMSRPTLHERLRR